MIVVKYINCELTPMISNTGLTHLGSEDSNSCVFIKFYNLKNAIKSSKYNPYKIFNFLNCPL